MIHGLIQTIQGDFRILTDWAKGNDQVQVQEEDQQQRVQMAAARMLAFVGMAFGTLWLLSLLTFVVSIPATIILKLTTAVGIYALAHDIFIMTENAAQQDFQQNIPSRILNLFRGQEALEEDQARQFTHGTFLQPAWMWAYVNRNQIP